MCRFFGVSRSGYYDYVGRLDQPVHDAELAAIIREQQEKCDKTYGYRRMWKWLRKVKKIRSARTVTAYRGKKLFFDILNYKRDAAADKFARVGINGVPRLDKGELVGVEVGQRFYIVSGKYLVERVKYVSAPLGLHLRQPLLECGVYLFALLGD